MPDRYMTMTSVTLPIQIAPLKNLTVEELETLIPLVDEDFISLGGTSTPAELLNFFYQQEGSWVISGGLKPVGILGVKADVLNKNKIMMTTYIFGADRHNGYGSLVKRIASQAFLMIPNLELSACVREDDVNTLNMFNNVFPTIKPVSQTTLGKTYWCFELRGVVPREVLRFERDLFRTLNTWGNKYTSPTHSSY